MRSAPKLFLLGSVTIEDEGDVWVAAGFADSVDDDIPPEALPLGTAPLGTCAVIFLVIDGIIRGYVRNKADAPLTWLDFGWLCSTWPNASMVFMVPLAELDGSVSEFLGTMNEFVNTPSQEGAS